MAFLGRATDVDAHAVQSIHDIPRCCIISGHEERYQVDPESIGLPPWTDLRWRHLIGLLLRPWFSRVWIIQEAVLPARCNIYVGRYIFSLQHLQGFIRATTAFSSWILGLLNGNGQKTLTRTIHRITNICSLKDGTDKIRKDRLAYILQNSRAATATDPRDKVYGLLGLSTEVAPESAFLTTIWQSMRCMSRLRKL